MALIDLAKLNTEQLWAIQWGRQQANDNMKWQVDEAIAKNEQITLENTKLLPEHQKPLVTVPEYYTDQTWADEQILNWVNQRLQMFQTQVEQNVKETLAAKSLQERLEIMQQLKVKPVLRDE